MARKSAGKLIEGNSDEPRRFLALLPGTSRWTDKLPKSYVDVPTDRDATFHDLGGREFLGTSLDLATRGDAFKKVADFNRHRLDAASGRDVHWGLVIEVGSARPNPRPWVYFVVEFADESNRLQLRQKFVTDIKIVRPTADERRQFAVSADELAGAGV